MRKDRFIQRNFDLGTASTAFLAAFAIQLLFQAIVLAIGLSDAAKTWTIVIGNQLVLFGATLFFCFYYKVNPLAITGVKRPPKWYFFPIFILIAVFCVTAFAPLAGVFSHMLTRLGYDHSPSYYIPMENPGLFALAFLALTLLPVIGEEFAVRGMLLSGGKERSPIFAMIFTAAIFALMHGNFHQLLHQFLIGLVMGYLAYLTGGIYASAVVHIVNNGAALLLDYGLRHGMIDPRAYWYVSGEMGAKTTLIGMAVSVFAIVMLLVLVTVLTHRNRSQKEDFIPQDGTMSERIAAYLAFLSTAKEERDAEGKKPAKLDRYSWAMAIILIVALVVVVVVSIFSGK